MRYLPINLDLAGKPVLVIGGGPVATHKAKVLRACGARVTVVSPAFCSGMARLQRITRIRRGYRRRDLQGMALVISAAGPAAVNRRACRDASALGIPVNVVDQPEFCSFTVPALLARGEVMIAVSTGGSSPALAGRIRDLISRAIGPEFGRHAALLREFRTRVKATDLPLAERSRLLKTLAGDQIRECLRVRGLAAARAVARQHLAAALAQAPAPEAPDAPPSRGG